MPCFFIPGIDGNQEVEYARLRGVVRDVTQREPRARRIFSLSCRMDGRDCEVAVGQADPVSGGSVLAIFDVGGTEPYSVIVADDAPLRLSKRTIYSVTEFP